MSDDQNEEYLGEEYHFADDANLSLDETPKGDKKPSETEKAGSPSMERFDMDPEKIKAFFKENSPLRNVIVIVAILLALTLLYKMISVLFFHEKSIAHVSSIPNHVTVMPKAAPINNSSSNAMTGSTQTLDNQATMLQEMNAMKAKMASLEQTEVSLQNQVSTINNQLTTVNANINTIAEKLTVINQQMLDLRRVVQEQAERMVIVKEQARHRMSPPKRIYPRGPSIVYYLKAVIPGRAWLISTAGNTMTVRVGTPIPGYGVVRYIDAIQGRVLTSSGQLIRFSQDDS